jgi:hypothetical protein
MVMFAATIKGCGEPHYTRLAVLASMQMERLITGDIIPTEDLGPIHHLVLEINNTKLDTRQGLADQNALGERHGQLGAAEYCLAASRAQ